MRNEQYIQVTVSRSLEQGDFCRILEVDPGGGVVVLTCPPIFGLGFHLQARKVGAGTVRFEAGAGAAIVSPAGAAPELADSWVIATLDNRTGAEWAIDFVYLPEFDNRGIALVTASAPGGGGVVDFELDARSDWGLLVFLRLASVGGLASSATVRLYRDAARTDEIYASEGVDPSAGWTDRTPATLLGDDGSDLESRTVFGRITNNSAAASAFAVEAVIIGG